MPQFMGGLECAVPSLEHFSNKMARFVTVVLGRFHVLSSVKSSKKLVYLPNIGLAGLR